MIKRVSSGKAVKQEKQAVIPGLPVYGSIYLLDLGIEKTLNFLSPFWSWSQIQRRDDLMAMFALCGTKSWAVTKRMTQRGVEEIDIGLLIGPRCSLKSSSSPQEMSRWNRLLSASNNNPTTNDPPTIPSQLPPPSQVCMCHKMNSTSVDRSHPNSH